MHGQGRVRGGSVGGGALRMGSSAWPGEPDAAGRRGGGSENREGFIYKGGSEGSVTAYKLRKERAAPGGGADAVFCVQLCTRAPRRAVARRGGLGKDL